MAIDNRKVPKSGRISVSVEVKDEFDFQLDNIRKKTGDKKLTQNGLMKLLLGMED